MKRIERIETIKKQIKEQNKLTTEMKVVKEWDVDEMKNILNSGFECVSSLEIIYNIASDATILGFEIRYDPYCKWTHVHPTKNFLVVRTSGAAEKDAIKHLKVSVRNSEDVFEKQVEKWNTLNPLERLMELVGVAKRIQEENDDFLEFLNERVD